MGSSNISGVCFGAVVREKRHNPYQGFTYNIIKGTERGTSSVTAAMLIVFNPSHRLAIT